LRNVAAAAPTLEESTSPRIAAPREKPWDKAQKNIDSGLSTNRFASILIGVIRN